MLHGRPAIGYVVEVDGPDIVLNLNEGHRGQVAAHGDGVSNIGQPNDLLGIDGGTDLIVTRVVSIAYAEPKEAHDLGVGSENLVKEPLRQIRARSLGFISRKDGQLVFTPQEWRLPALGAEAFPLTADEHGTTSKSGDAEQKRIQLGWDARTGTVAIEVDIDTLLGRHVAVLGATGQGKTTFIAALMQRLLGMVPNSRLVIFDMNGEYAQALADVPNASVVVTVLGRPPQVGGRARRGQPQYYRVPYYALGRHGLARLLLPSEKTQMPALRFAIDHLPFVQTEQVGVGLVGQAGVLFDDCRRDGAAEALRAIQLLRDHDVPRARAWPHMRALSALAAEWYSVQTGQRGPERSAFLYAHVQSLVNRIRGLMEDERFQEVVIVDGGAPAVAELSIERESEALVDRIFGPTRPVRGGWNVHIVDLSRVAQDLTPFVLGALLESYAAQLFLRGPGASHPTLLALEEAHHYLRQLPGDSETGQHALAYERLAKEGRKFGLSLLISTQRPSEVSPTVLAQCGTWCVFRLTNEQDQRAVAAAAESAGGFVVKQIPGLPRGQAVIFGAAMPIPAVASVIRANPEPRSADADFFGRWTHRREE